MNPLDKFQLLSNQVLESLFIDRMEVKEELFARFMNDPRFQQIVAEGLGEIVYDRLPKSTDSGKNYPVNEARP